MKFINLTHREIVIVDEDGRTVMSLKPSGIIVGSTTDEKIVETYDSTDCVLYDYKDVSGLPDEAPDTRLVVSYAVLQALRGSRADVISPDTSPGSVVRENGSQRVLGVKRFRKL